MSSRTHAVLIQMVLDAAERQGRDVLGVVPCHTGLPGWGRRSTTWCLLYRKDAATPWCVTPHYEGDPEFGPGTYFESLEGAQKEFVQRVRREWLDVKLHGQEADKDTPPAVRHRGTDHNA